ncbi:DUF4870 domain-containing protein [Candidatus Dojkabacteria bacterium]|nr:DUF4870 domain-containing protein [Candidatus Dojkabacteria bacterium]
MAEKKSKAKKEIKLEDIKFNKDNQAMAVLAAIPIVGLILFFVEKEDNFVRYVSAQSVLLSVAVGLMMAVVVIPCIGMIITIFIGLAFFVLTIITMVKASQGERFDYPLLSDLAVQLINAV